MEHDEQKEDATIGLNYRTKQSRVDAIDDWSFANRERSRTKAIDALIDKGLHLSKVEKDLTELGEIYKLEALLEGHTPTDKATHSGTATLQDNNKSI